MLTPAVPKKIFTISPIFFIQLLLITNRVVFVVVVVVVVILVFKIDVEIFQTNLIAIFHIQQM